MYTQSPVKIKFNSYIYLSGGIKKCPRWREEVKRGLGNTDLHVYDPFNPAYKDKLEDQVAWEVEAIEMSTAIFFWFPKESLCTKAVLELGTVLYGDKKLFIGMEDGYIRRDHLIAHIVAVRSNQNIINDLKRLTQLAAEWGRGEW